MVCLQTELTKIFMAAWTQAEDEVLTKGIQKYGTGKWHTVAALLPGRTTNQVRNRYFSYLRSLIHTAWNPQLDKVLTDAVAAHGQNWQNIAIATGSPAQACLERYEILENRRAGLPDNTPSLAASTATYEHKPAVANPVDLDEETREALATAEARMAQDNGRKAQRKLRERFDQDRAEAAAVERAVEQGTDLPPLRNNHATNIFESSSVIDLTEDEQVPPPSAPRPASTSLMQPRSISGPAVSHDSRSQRPSTAPVLDSAGRRQEPQEPQEPQASPQPSQDQGKLKHLASLKESLEDIQFGQGKLVVPQASESLIDVLNQWVPTAETTINPDRHHTRSPQTPNSSGREHPSSSLGSIADRLGARPAKRPFQGNEEGAGNKRNSRTPRIPQSRHTNGSAEQLEHRLRGNNFAARDDQVDYQGAPSASRERSELFSTQNRAYDEVSVSTETTPDGAKHIGRKDPAEISVANGNTSTENAPSATGSVQVVETPLFVQPSAIPQDNTVQAALPNPVGREKLKSVIDVFEKLSNRYFSGPSSSTPAPADPVPQENTNQQPNGTVSSQAIVSETSSASTPAKASPNEPKTQPPKPSPSPQQRQKGPQNPPKGPPKKSQKQPHQAPQKPPQRAQQASKPAPRQPAPRSQQAPPQAARQKNTPTNNNSNARGPKGKKSHGSDPREPPSKNPPRISEPPRSIRRVNPNVAGGTHKVGGANLIEMKSPRIFNTGEPPRHQPSPASNGRRGSVGQRQTGQNDHNSGKRSSPRARSDERDQAAKRQRNSIDPSSTEWLKDFEAMFD